MLCGIYKIENTLNGKIYIGQAVDIIRRWAKHLNDCANPNVDLYDGYFYRSLRKYGVENFTFQVVELCSQDELDCKEIYWIKKYDSFNNGYNQTLGGSKASKVDREAFFQYYTESQHSMADIMEHFNICRETVSRVTNELSLEPNWLISEDEKNMICNKYVNSDCTILQLAKDVGRDPQTISRILHKNQIPIRNGKVRKHDYYVYDCNTSELLFMLSQASLPQLCDELVNRNILDGRVPKHSTVWNHILRNGMKLYDKITIRIGDDI